MSMLWFSPLAKDTITGDPLSPGIIRLGAVTGRMDRDSGDIMITKARVMILKDDWTV